MTSSPSIATLQSLLRSADPSSASSSSASSSTIDRTDLSSPSSSSSQARTYASTSYWTSTLSSAFGYRAKSHGNEEDRQGISWGIVKGRSGRGKGKERAGIPSWVEEEANETAGETKGAESEGDEQGSEVEEDDDEELLRSILWKVNSRPDERTSDDDETLLLLACSRIPEATSTLSHSELLDKLRIRLERFAAKGSYSIVLLVNPTPHPPSTPQLVSSYLALSRTSRKNLSKLYVVGGGWWTRVILTLFSSTLLSLKVSQKKKIVQCSSLTQLAKEMGTKRFTRIEFPLEVYVENGKIEKGIELPDEVEAVFGRELDEICGPDGTQLPPILEDCLSLLLLHAPSSLGIFRRSPSSSTLKVLQLAYSQHHPVSLGSYPDAPHLAASLLKSFLRELPSPILSRELCESEVIESVEEIRENVLEKMDGTKREVLKRVVEVLARVNEKRETNLMGSENLVVCLAPCLIGGIFEAEQVKTIRVAPSRLGEMEGMNTGRGKGTVGGVLKRMIEKYDEIFDPPHAQPLPSTSQDTLSPWSSSIPSSPTRDRTIRKRVEPTKGTTERTNVRGIFATGLAEEEEGEEEEEEGKE
ncbi:uncharacterized protein JCM6883_001438 [Sporobolomyces salmoneus]|uniref:uncharacterized protein n=1 Tax=Sporobolomyces salmoneus TaxID=183962 RepID=UPI00317D045A